MKVNSTILLELNKRGIEILNEKYTRTVAKMIASELSSQEMDELLEKLMIS